MVDYSLDDDSGKMATVGDLSLVIPYYRCENCGTTISEYYFEETGECYSCRVDENVTDGLECIYTVSIYLPEEHRSEEGILEDISRFSDSIYQAKRGEFHSEMAGILKYGFQEFTALDQAELVVYPPSGEGGDNHMKSIAELLEPEIGMRSADIMKKDEDYSSQKSQSSVEERKENLDGKIGVNETSLQDINLSEIDRVVVIDDVVVTGSTMSNTAQELIDQGVDEVYGLAVARNESVENLVDHAELLEEG